MKELDQLKTYLTSDSSEDAKRQFVYPLFQKLFKKAFKTESDAEGADGYIAGKLLIELKSRNEDWLNGFYQGLHYLKKGLSFPNICVISNKFIGLWKINAIPEDVKKIADEADPLKAPNEIGNINANKTNKFQKQKLLYSNVFLIERVYFDGYFMKRIDVDISVFLYAIKNLDSVRIQINKRNFIDCIDIMMKQFFDDPLKAIHCFYSIIGSWDATSTVAINKEKNEISVIGLKGSTFSDIIKIKPEFHTKFKNYIENRYIFTNEGSGFTADYYFSRFDEVISRLKPEYAREHGIFFTDHNLSKFALWFVRHYFERKLSDNYFVFDPAGGSGNLVTSWHGHLKHKIVSELEPDLLKTIEKRMKLDDYNQGKYTIIPKTIENIGLNFLDKSAEEYLNEIQKVLKEKNLELDKPLAFLLNPPYRNTDENEKFLKQHNADYNIHESILDVTGSDAGRERYLAFLGQILNISKYQYSLNNNLKPILMIFTPTSWLIPRPTYVNFRKEFDKFFKFEKGFIITSNEFFAIPGKWPLAFTIWSFDINEERNNKIRINDYTELKKDDININWDDKLKNIDIQIKNLIKTSKTVKLNLNRKDIRYHIPKLKRRKRQIIQPRYDFSYAKKEKDYGHLISGFPRRDKKRHFELKRKCGDINGKYIGFMDDNTPVRLSQDTCNRMSNKPDRVWFLLMHEFKNVNRTRIHNGATDKYGFCAYNLESSKLLFCWFAITKVLVGKYPTWVNQLDLWKPKITQNLEKCFYSLCFAFGLAENRCVVTKFEKDNPVKGSPEIFVDNPLSTNNPESFWNTTLESHILKSSKESVELVSSIKELYSVWLKEYCPSVNLYNIGLKDEPYFKYFDYDDFLTKDSGLIQIRKFAEINNKQDLLELFATISAKTKKVKNKIYQLLIKEFEYFG